MGNDKMKKKKNGRRRGGGRRNLITLQTHYLMPLFKLLSRRRDESVGIYLIAETIKQRD